MIIKVDKSNIFYDDIIDGITSDYFRYIIDIIIKVIKDNNLAVNIFFRNTKYKTNIHTSLIKINVNIEHTLVLKDGRGVYPNCPKGSIKTFDENDTYLVRIDNYNELNINDIVIDYSIPNIINIKSCPSYSEFSQKIIYISPKIYDNYKLTTNDRQIHVLTTFINTTEPRRNKLINDMKINNINHTNYNNCFEKLALYNLLCNTKILINIHQTDHHHTFEELRVLPALLCGVIVISEESPLSETIPYNNLIIWKPYNKIIETINDVINNYDIYYQKIFTPSVKDLFDTLHNNNIKIIRDKLIYTMEQDLEYYSKLYILDKSISTGNHNYIPGYSTLFNNIRNKVKTLLEIGIGSIENGQMGGPNGNLALMGYKTGNSLRCWRDYFHNATIYGIDIFKHDINEERIVTFQADQYSERDLLSVISLINNNLDIIIDDGSHNENHQVFSFMTLEKYLSPNGIYVIEDIQPPFIEKFKDLSIFPSDFRQHILNNFEIKIFDTRSTINRQDDFMMAFIRK